MLTTGYPALDAYFEAKNRKDIDAALAPFAEGAIVKDESHTHRGRAAIRAWMEETTAKYDDTAEPSGVEVENGRVKVAALVSGNFPGSPATLHFMFRLDADCISHLEIGA
ncbi:nuclear transport factor 2 family protein [Mesorhizobium sp. KR9-304]|uniref:nuclear transport factor 2 family protein n=1 Tax=Mesorhizobium sp. KR9-304 TaxID=3156614 RepID=UPI0032B5152F